MNENLSNTVLLTFENNWIDFFDEMLMISLMIWFLKKNIDRIFCNRCNRNRIFFIFDWDCDRFTTQLSKNINDSNECNRLNERDTTDCDNREWQFVMLFIKIKIFFDAV